MNVHYSKAILASLFLFCLSVFSEENNLEVIKLKASEESASYRMVKISDRYAIGNWDSKKEFVYFDLREMKSFFSAEGGEASSLVAHYIAEITDNFSKSIILINLIKREYYFSSYWTDSKNPLNVESFQKISYESDINRILGPLASIPTRVDGVARFNLRHNGEIVQFLGFASKKTFTIAPKYWAYFELFQPQDKTVEKNDIAILVANAPNDSMGFNGIYILVPKRVLASNKKSI